MYLHNSPYPLGYIYIFPHHPNTYLRQHIPQTNFYPPTQPLLNETTKHIPPPTQPPYSHKQTPYPPHPPSPTTTNVSPTHPPLPKLRLHALNPLSLRHLVQHHRARNPSLSFLERRNHHHGKEGLSVSGGTCL